MPGLSDLSGLIYHSPSAEYGWYFTACPAVRATVGDRPANEGGWDRRSRENCAVTLRRAAAAWIIGRLPHNGMLEQPLGAQSLQSWRSTRRCGHLCRSSWPAWSSCQAELRFTGGRKPGKIAGMYRGRSGVEHRPGALSRLPTASGTISLAMKRCASATKPSPKTLRATPWSFAP